MAFLVQEEPEGIFCIENEFWCFRHDRKHGGELVEATVKNGSGNNLLTTSQSCAVALKTGNKFHVFSTGRQPAIDFSINHKIDGVTLSFYSIPQDNAGKELDGVVFQHHISYSENGSSHHQVILHANRRIENPGQIQIEKLEFANIFDYSAVREELSEQCAGENGNWLWRWNRIHEEIQRKTILLSRHLPLSVLLLRRNVEAFEFSLGDNLAAWDLYPGQAQFLLGTNSAGHLVLRYCVLDSLRPVHALEGTYKFSFRLTLPKIRSTLAPLVPMAGNFLRRTGNFCDRWANAAKLPVWRETGAQILRLHDDGDAFGNGIFWRDGATRPYPLEEENKMRRFLDVAHANGIAVVPYFSMKEFHPEVPEFRKESSVWARRIDSAPELLFNYSPKAIFGAQMCLKSDWKHFRLNTVREIVTHYGFDGVYCDWCAGSECISREHECGRHWDNDALLEELEEFRRLGRYLYLHLTGTPSLAAENLADIILTEEQPYVDGIGPRMFTPHADFVNIASRQVCEMLSADAPDTERRKLALVALLHHATISSVHDVYQKFYHDLNISQELVRYQHYRAPATGVVQCSSHNCGASLYWNNDGILALFANFSEKTLYTSYHIAPENASGIERNGKLELAPLMWHAVRFPVL